MVLKFPFKRLLQIWFFQHDDVGAIWITTGKWVTRDDPPKQVALMILTLKFPLICCVTLKYDCLSCMCESLHFNNFTPWDNLNSQEMTSLEKGIEQNLHCVWF